MLCNLLDVLSHLPDGQCLAKWEEVGNSGIDELIIHHYVTRFMDSEAGFHLSPTFTTF